MKEDSNEHKVLIQEEEIKTLTLKVQRLEGIVDRLEATNLALRRLVSSLLGVTGHLQGTVEEMGRTVSHATCTLYRHLDEARRVASRFGIGRADDEETSSSSF